MADATLENARPNRMSRQRQKTRDRLVNAALSVMAEKGADAATINDITEAADVGFGSFYNHFSSKEEILAVAIKELFERIGNQIDATVKVIVDPLESIATAIRLFIGIMIQHKEWARFIVRFSIVPGYKEVGLIKRLFRDIRGLEKAGRLRESNSDTAGFAITGVIVFMVNAVLESDLSAGDAPERVAAVALRILGANEEEIVSLLSRPLPQMTKRR